MIDTAALMFDEILLPEPIRQWVPSIPIPLRSLFASQPAIMSSVLSIVLRAISGHLRWQELGTRVQRRRPGP